MENLTRPQRLVTDQQLREAEEGLRRLLHAKRFPRGWIEEYGPEVMSQARTEFAARLAVEHIDNTVGLLVVIAYRRAQNLVRSERSRPQVTSIETAFHLADEETLTPEEEALDHDRQLRLVEAMSHLPERERKLLALVYFEEMPLGKAGRKLGWAKASATRHHQAALDRLRALVGDRSLLSPEIAIPAFVAAHHHSVPRAIFIWLGGAAETLRDAAVLGSGRVGPMAETGNSAALSGAGRTAAGVCAVAATCVVAATGVVGPGLAAIGGKGDGHQGADRHRPRAERRLDTSRRFDQAASTPTAVPAPPSASRSGGSRAEGAKGHRDREAAPTEKQVSPTGTSRGAAPSHKENVNEFGVEQGEAETVAESKAEPQSTPPPAAARPIAPASPAGTTTTSPGSSSGPSSGSSSAGSEARAEVGM